MIFSRSFFAATKEYNTYESHVANPQFRKSFNLSVLPKTAELTICGLGYYEVYLNGNNITKGFMAPYRSNLNHYVYYDNYDLSEYLTEGENVLGVLLGNGFLNPSIEKWDFSIKPDRSAPKVALSMEIDGNQLFDASALKCIESPITFEEFHSGEHYDARQEKEGWKNSGFDDSSWRSVIPADAPLGEPRIPDCEPIGIIDVHYPARILKSKEGFIYDFAVNASGLCELNIKGCEGRKIELRYGELLRNGELDVRNVSYNEWMHKDCYILKGGSKEKYMPHFTYHGFRFVEVIGITEAEATPDLLTFYEMSSSFEQISDFKCDNASLNALFDATMRSNRANFIYFPTDCPHREKNGWTGDAVLSAEQHLIYLDCAKSLKEWLRNIFKAQNEEGTIPGIVPTHDWGYDWVGPAWDIVMFELPYRIYQYTGDTEIISEGRSHLLRYFKYMESKRDEAGLLCYGLGDWCHSDFQQYEITEQLQYTSTITCKYLCDIAVVLFGAIGDDESARYAKELSDDIKKAFRNSLMNEDLSLKCPSQTTYAMAIYYGMFDESECSKACERLENIIHKNEDKISFGVLGNRAVFRVLAECGKIDLALKMMLNPEPPSFKCWIDQGATSLFEAFFPFRNRVDSFDDAPTPDSLNHHFWGDIIAVFMRHLAGIQVESCKSVVIAPQFSDILNNVEAYETVFGEKVSLKYKKTDVMLSMTVTVPGSIKARLIVPKGYRLSRGKETLKSGENHLIFCKK